MYKPKFNKYKLELDLEAQSPMIHFQPSQPGATLRASEVKPKLDRFMVKRLTAMTGRSVSELRESSDYGSIFTDKEHDALNYKLQIVAGTKGYQIVTVGKSKEYGIFYGNNGPKDKKQSEDKKKLGVFSNPHLTILCFKEKLRALIEASIVPFFIVTNFGTMQSKGFGSFVPSAICGGQNKLDWAIQKEIAGYLKAETGSARCYCMKFGNVPNTPDGKNSYSQKQFDEIKSFYSVMKSGQNFRGYARSYLYQYMHGADNRNNAGDVSIDNEKAWMKQSGIAPVVAKPENKKRADMKDENPRYVRALLGVAGAVSYLNESRQRETITIEDKDKSKEKIERMSSPVFFKIIKNVVFITAREVPEEIYDRKFEFYNKKTGKGGAIKTPSKSDFQSGRFDIQDFLAKYVKYYNSSELREKQLYDIKNNKRVEEVQC